LVRSCGQEEPSIARVSGCLRLVKAAAVEPAATVWALQDQLQPTVFNSLDAKEGATAFIERRAPVWQGR